MTKRRIVEDLGNRMYWYVKEEEVVLGDQGHPFRPTIAAPATMTRGQWLLCRLRLHRWDVIGTGDHGEGLFSIFECERCRAQRTLNFKHDAPLKFMDPWIEWWHRKKRQP